MKGNVELKNISRVSIKCSILIGSTILLNNGAINSRIKLSKWRVTIDSSSISYDIDNYLASSVKGSNVSPDIRPSMSM